MFSHTISHQWTNGGSTISKSVVKTAGLEANLSEEIPAESTDLEVAWSCDVSELKSLMMVCDQDVTIKTNSSSVADDTFVLAANVPLTYQDGLYTIGGSPNANPFSGDVTSIFVTNAGEVNAKLDIRAIVDPTP